MSNLSDIEFFTLSDMANALGLTGVFLFFMVPSIVAVMIFYYIRRRKKERVAKKRLKNNDNNSSDSATKQAKRIKDSRLKMEEPKDKERFSSLELTFNEEGFAEHEKKEH